MDSKVFKAKNRESGTLSATLLAATVNSANVTPVPANAPGVIVLRPGTAYEEHIYYKTRDAGAGTISGLTRDYTNLNGGTGFEHVNGSAWETLQSAEYLNNLVDAVIEGYQQEQATIAYVGATSFTVLGDVTAFYTAGRILRYNQDNTKIGIVASSSYSGGSGLTTVVTNYGTVPATLTHVELGIMPKSATNLLALISGVQNGSYFYAADSGGSDAYAITVSPAITAYVTGQFFLFKANTANTGAATLNVNGVGALTIKKNKDQTLADGDIKAGQLVLVQYDGTDLQMLSQIGNQVDLSTVTPVNGWVSAGETPTYSSVDTATGVLTVASGAKNKFSLGTKVKFDQSQALTSYWSFDSNSNDGVGSNNGTDTAMSYASAGKFSNGATFNGTTSKIVLTDAASLKPTTEFTIGLWVKTSVTGTAKGLFQSYSANTNIAGIDLYIDTDNAVHWVNGNNTATTIWNGWTRIDGTTNVCDNSWHYVVISYRNNWGQMYVDGRLEAAGWMFTPAYAGTNYPRIGARNTTGTDGSLMSGMIDDLFLINGYALDEGTISAKYDAQTAQGTGSITVTKMGIVHANTDTSLTLFMGTDFTLANAAITNFYYSHVKAPVGFIAKDDKWMVKYVDGADRSAALSANTWTRVYNSHSLDIPIGCFKVDFMASGHADRTTAGTGDSAALAISTSTSTATDDELVCMNGYYGSSVANSSDLIGGAAYRTKTINLRAKTTHYLVAHMQNAGTYYIQPAQQYSGLVVIRAISGWL